VSDWITDLKQSEKKAVEAAQIQAELAVHENRRYSELIDEGWEALQSQLDNDAKRLDKGITIKTTTAPSIQLQRFGLRGACVAVRLQREARQIRVAYSHSDNGIHDEHDGIERLSIALNGDRISVLGHADLSRHLLTRLLEESDKR
jgi:hypothetical protein